MVKNTYEYPKSSFLGMEKDLSIVMNKILSNQNVLRLLYYNSPDCLKWGHEKNVTSEQIKEMFRTKQIDIVPNLLSGIDKKTYLRVIFNNFVPNDTNPFYRDHLMEIQILCHYENWNMGNYQLRPYKIAGEIDAMLNKTHLTGIGLLELVTCNQVLYDDIYGGVSIRYLVTSGNEDKVNPLE